MSWKWRSAACALTVAAVLGLASTAAALSVIVLTGSAKAVTQAFDPDQDKEFQETDDVITFDFQLEQPAFISGYDIHVQWDANELDLLQLQERRSGGLEPIFDMAPDPNSEPLDTSDVRVAKSFTMSYARMETRSIFHNNFPTRSANIVPRAIYESPFIQKKWAFSAVLTTSPDGVIGIGADNDLIALDRRVSASTSRRHRRR